MSYKLALITPKNKNDYLTDTVIDGLLSLQTGGEAIEFYLSSNYPGRFDYGSRYLERDGFKKFSEEADLILMFWGKGNTDYSTAEFVNRYDKTVFVDGSESGKNNRLDFVAQYKLLRGEYDGNGIVEKEILAKCPLYFKREKPYLSGVLPFPFGIERSYCQYYVNSPVKDLDFFCVFGQDEYPLLRRYAKEVLVDFCKENGFSYFVDKTDRGNFYKLLSRAKVGISVGGGGYDTARFWEILGNNCMLLTEKIDIYQPDSERLKYDRIWQFNNLFDFQYQLNKLGNFLKNEYNQDKLEEEYKKIMAEHSSAARVMEIISEAKNKKLVR